MTRRVAIVTGGLTGIGRASVQALSAQGHCVVAGSRRAFDGAGRSAEDILGADGTHLPLDVSDAGSVNRFVEQVVTEFGAPAILVNAAGIYMEAALTAPDTDSWHKQIDINLTGPFLMTQAVMEHMIAGQFGRIVNIASTAGTKGAAGYAGYCASKAGLIALSKVTAVEGAPHNISCVSLSPTWVETPMMDNAVIRHARDDGTNAKDAKEALQFSNPQNRLVQPEEIAAMVAFCCGETCPALTNEDIQINAGADW